MWYGQLDVRRLTLRERWVHSAWIEAVIALCLLVQVSALGHFVFVQHETCAEHGEAIHADEPGQHSAGAHEKGQISGGFALAPEEGSGVDVHDHCPLVPDRAPRALLVLDATHDTLCPARSPVERPNAAWIRWSPTDLRLLAPKTSPPV